MTIEQKGEEIIKAYILIFRGETVQGERILAIPSAFKYISGKIKQLKESRSVYIKAKVDDLYEERLKILEDTLNYINSQIKNV